MTLERSFRIGPTLVINAKVKHQTEEKEAVMIETMEAPAVINSFKNDAEEYVKNWYKNCEKQPIVQATETTEELGYAQAPPACVASEGDTQLRTQAVAQETHSWRKVPRMIVFGEEEFGFAPAAPACVALEEEK